MCVIQKAFMIWWDFKLTWFHWELIGLVNDLQTTQRHIATYLIKLILPSSYYEQRLVSPFEHCVSSHRACWLLLTTKEKKIPQTAALGTFGLFLAMDEPASGSVGIIYWYGSKSQNYVGLQVTWKRPSRVILSFLKKIISVTEIWIQNLNL